ncbi:hypothetical protein GCM10023206_19900 [Acinetobacter puyangensis]|nr:siderophore-interacting protein [Acinetobacter puyangensis]
MMKSLTVIQDDDRKLDIMDHVNQDHSKELLIIAQSYGKNRDIYYASITDIFEEGILLHIRCEINREIQELFVAFELKGDLEEQILYLAYHSFVKQNIELDHNARNYFEIVDKSRITPNFMRLMVKSQTALPQYYAGYAYGFILKTLQKMPPVKKNNIFKKNNLFKNRFDRGFLWIMKYLSRQKRQKLLESINKDIRLYTLRQAFNPLGTEGLSYGYIDIFTHGDSAGSQWVEVLQAGTLISSRTETDDKHAHLEQGQTVLIADETAYPAVAGILDFWKNPVPPLVILLASDIRDHAYFDHFNFPPQSEIYKISSQTSLQAEKVIAILKQKTLIENVWGALENEAAKQIRHYLRNQRQLKGKNNHIKGYWRLEKV